MKKCLLTVALLATVLVYARERIEVNEKILLSFKKTFRFAEDVSWSKTKDLYQANFWQGDMTIIAKYNEEGALVSTMRYYYEKELPVHILDRLKKKYPGEYAIIVVEVTENDDVHYYMTLQNDEDIYKVDSDIYGNIRQTKKYKNATSN